MVTTYKHSNPMLLSKAIFLPPWDDWHQAKLWLYNPPHFRDVAIRSDAQNMVRLGDQQIADFDQN
jgi:hypothetical protein